jgi:class 3 adenylate cyclase
MSDEKENLFEHLDRLMSTGHDPLEVEPEIWRRFGRQVAVMVLDSSGFSRVSETHGILHFLSRLVLMRKIVKPILDSNGPISVSFAADNAFAVYDHPDHAITAALKVHREVDREKLMLTETEPFRVCIGIGYGHMLYSETLEGYFGEEMNLASKLGEDTAEGGETLLTMSAYESASPDLIKDFEQTSVDISGLHVDHYRVQHPG